MATPVQQLQAPSWQLHGPRVALKTWALSPSPAFLNAAKTKNESGISHKHAWVRRRVLYLPSVGKVTLMEYPGGWAPRSLAANPATPRARNIAKLKWDDMFHVQVQEVTSQRLHWRIFSQLACSFPFHCAAMEQRFFLYSRFFGLWRFSSLIVLERKSQESKQILACVCVPLIRRS